MRIAIDFAPVSSHIIPFSYQQKFLGLLHKFIGENNREHDDISLYSWFVQGTKLAETGFDVSNGCSWVVSGWDADFVTNIAKEATAYKEEFLGLRVCSVRNYIEPPMAWQKRFNVGSPVFVKNWANNNAQHLRFDNPSASEVLTRILHKKMEKVGLGGDVTVRFDRLYKKAKTKLIEISNVKNRCNVCPVIIEGAPELIRFAWEVGVGSSTGCGFGGVV